MKKVIDILNKNEKKTISELMKSNKKMANMLLGVKSINELKDGLNDDQQRAFDEIVDYILSDSEYQGIVLSGYAGTGKTFLIKRIVEWLNISGKVKIAITAPTNKAVHILDRDNPYQQKTNRFSKKAPAIIYTTIHKLLGLTELITDDGQQTFVKQNESLAEQYDVIIVDEVSMLNDDLLDTIISLDTKLILMGDKCQIPPVNKIDCEVYRDDCRYKFKHTQLNKIMRQADDNPIIAKSIEIREHLDKSVPTPHITQINGENGVIYIEKDIEETVTKLCREYFDCQAYMDNRDYMKVICWRNKTIDYFNNSIRRILFNTETRFNKGESLIASSILFNKYEDKFYIKANNSEEFVVDDDVEIPITTNIGKHEFTSMFHQLRVHTYNGRELMLNVIRKECMPDLIKFQNELKAHAKAKPNRFTWLDYYDSLKISDNVGYNYAISAHRSQGSTYENVLMIERDMNYNTRLIERNRIKYTAFTRAKHKLFIV